MELWQFALLMFGNMMLYSLVLPAATGTLMFQGFKHTEMAEKAPFGLCFKVAFASAYASFFTVFLLRYLNVLPDQGALGGRLIMTATMASLQLLLVVVLMRNNAPKALAIEVGSVLLVHAAVFGITLLINPIGSMTVVR